MLLQTRSLVACGLFIFSFALPAYSQTEPNPDKVDSTINEIIQDVTSDVIPIISLDDDGSDGGSQNISSLLFAGRDPFLNAAAYKFSAVRFRIRGYDSDMFGTYMNGAPMENLDNGFTPYGQWGGLNDALRNRDNAHGLRPTTYAFGEPGGISYIDSRASVQRAQTSINYASTNRNYSNRLMVTHATGMNKSGWAFAGTASRRWADEGYVPGTYYNGWSFYVGVDKRFDDRHLLSFVAFGTPTENGRQGAAVDEMLDIAGDNFYNPNWGYQNGKKRNARVAKTFQPIGILTHEWKISDKMQLLTAASYTTGKRGTTALDWYNAPDPRPDYYRYLPSYQLTEEAQAAVYNAMLNDVNLRQINWDKIYNVNYASQSTVKNANGIDGYDYSGKRARYILEDRVINTTKYNFNTTLNATLNAHVELSAGAAYQSQDNHYYKEIDDLLGAEFYVDVNQFAERDYRGNVDAAQNDLNRPNRIVKEGDKFGYNYNFDIKKASAWVQSVFKFNKVDFFVGAEHTYTGFWRTGNVKSGLFPQNSYGKSKRYDFYNYSAKAGVTYKFDGRNYLFVNGTYLTRAPFFENAFIAPRTRDMVQEDLQSEKILSGEAGYIYNAPGLKLRATGYYTQFRNQMNVLSFYNDQYQNFVNYAISNIGKTHAGVEFGAEAKVYKGLSVNAAAAFGRHYYDTRQNAVVTVDNSSEVLAKEIVYSKNFRVPTPQEAYTIGLDYRSPKFWFVNLNANYFNKMWLDYNPLRRTYNAVSGIDQQSNLYRDIIEQQELDPQFSLDMFAGYSWRMRNRFKSVRSSTYLVFNLGVNNLLNNKNIVSGGYEQLRFDFEEKNVDKFPARRYFAYGINYFASIGLRF